MDYHPQMGGGWIAPFHRLELLPSELRDIRAWQAPPPQLADEDLNADTAQQVARRSGWLDVVARRVAQGRGALRIRMVKRI